MNPDFPKDPRAELESSLTALLLGELPHDQAAALHLTLAQDTELSKLYDRLKQTIALVRETAATPAEQLAPQPAPLKLSDARRQKLLAHFKTVTPKQFAEPQRWDRRQRLMAVAAAVAICGLLAAISLPYFLLVDRRLR